MVGSCWNAAVRPWSWELWKQPKPLVAYFLFWIVAALVGIIADSWFAPKPSGVDWLRFGALLCCSTAHLIVTRRQEESARSRGYEAHIEVTTIWSYAAVLILPASLAIALVVFIRLQRWFIARRSLHRFVFSSSLIIFAVLVSHFVLDLLGFGGGQDPVAGGSSWNLLAAAVGGLVYVVVQALIVAGGFALLMSGASTRTLFGGKYENLLEIFGVGLAIVTAILLATAPIAVVVMIPVALVISYVAEARQLRAAARTDPKTDLLNMRGWEVASERELARAERGGSSTGLLMIDLDHFKDINDAWGHPAGDDMLVAFAAALREETRPADVVGRFGGEEFVVLLPGADRYEAAAVAERILKRVRQLRVATTDKRGGPALISGRSASIGVASHPDDAATLDALVQASDAAVYDAKESGRDRVCLAPQ